MGEDFLVLVQAVFRNQQPNAQRLARRLNVRAPRTGAYASCNGEGLPTIDSMTGRHTATAVALADGGRLFEVSGVVVETVMCITADRYGTRSLCHGPTRLDGWPRCLPWTVKRLR